MSDVTPRARLRAEEPLHLDDDELRDEIEMVAELVIAASTATEPLSSEEIDAILGVAH